MRFTPLLDPCTPANIVQYFRQLAEVGEPEDEPIEAELNDELSLQQQCQIGMMLDDSCPVCD